MRGKLPVFNLFAQIPLLAVTYQNLILLFGIRNALAYNKEQNIENFLTMGRLYISLLSNSLSE